MPHMLLYGPPGTGKTSSILALVKEMQGPNQKDHVREFNASDDRSINVVRQKIKSFCESLPKKGTHPSTGRPLPPFNVIILDEADAMTQDAQFALRRIIELYSNTCRCAKFWFKGLSDDSQLERLELICKTEQIAQDRNALRQLLSFTEGDLRRSINMLQSCHAVQDGVSMANLDVVFGKVDDGRVDAVLAVIGGRDKGKAVQMAQELLAEGWALDILLAQLADKVISADSVSDQKKTQLIKALSDTESQFTDGGSEELNLTSCFATMSTIGL